MNDQHEARGQAWHDCDEVVRAWVDRTVAALAGRLESAGFVGAYLHGSLAAGSFYPPKSDVDVLFVVERALPAPDREAFARACVALTGERPLVGGFECSVVLGAAVAVPDHPIPFEVHFGEEWVEDILSGAGDFAIQRRDGDLAAHCQAVREVGVRLIGRPKQDVFGPVPREAFLDSVESDLAWILEGEHILQSPFYGVLNACRVLWVWSGHSPRLVPSKEEAGEWALEHVEDPLCGVVRAALDAYRDPSPVSGRDRRLGGRKWDEAALIAFRDHARRRRSQRGR